MLNNLILPITKTFLDNVQQLNIFVTNVYDRIKMTDCTMYQNTSAENAETNDETPNTTVLEGGTKRGLQQVDGENFDNHRIYYNTAAEYAPIDEEESKQ